jgi:arginine decarboxylase-like protein|tara:strand:- start:690 stop:1037 length:348 start_codon:yes stop_codon:yes gene_type:complete
MSSVFQKNIQEWVTVDNQIKTLNQEIKELRGNRNSLTNNIFTYAESNNLENAVIQISDGKLKFQNLKQTAPISFKLVKEVLNECIDNEEHVEAIITAIKNKRESKYTYDIKRTYA